MKSSWAAHASPDLRGPLNISPHFLPITYEHFRYADNPPRKIDKALTRLVSIRNGRGGISKDSTDNKRITGEYYEQLYACKF